MKIDHSGDLEMRHKVIVLYKTKARIEKEVLAQLAYTGGYLPYSVSTIADRVNHFVNAEELSEILRNGSLRATMQNVAKLWRDRYRSDDFWGHCMRIVRDTKKIPIIISGCNDAQQMREFVRRGALVLRIKHYPRNDFDGVWQIMKCNGESPPVDLYNGNCNLKEIPQKIGQLHGTIPIPYTTLL